MRISPIVAVALLALVVVLGGVGGWLGFEALREVPPEPVPGRLEAIALLQDRDFEALERRFPAPAEAEPQGGPVTTGYEQFAHSDPANRDALDAWAAERPESLSARLARGRYLRHLGWISRGTRLAAVTPEQRLSAMSDFFHLAMRDYEAALAQRDDLVEAYVGLLDVATALGSREEVEALRERGFAAVGDDPRLQMQYVRALEPRWGGDLIRYREYLEDLQRRTAGDPAYLWATDKIIAQQGFDIEGADPGKALELFTEAVEQTGSFAAYERRGNLELRLGHPEAALRDFEQAIRLEPDDPLVRFDKAQILLNRRAYESARETMAEALELDPYNPTILVRWSWLLASLLDRFGVDRRPEIRDQIADSLDRLMVFAGADPHTHWMRGDFAKQFEGDHAKAAESYRRAIELKPDSAQYWLDYAVSLYRAQSCEALPAIKVYEELCALYDDCEPSPEWPQAIGRDLDWCAGAGDDDKPA